MNITELIQATKQWGIDRQITGPNGKGTTKAQADKMIEEAEETWSAVANDDIDEIKDGIGDTMVTLILLAEMHGWTLRECLQAAYDVISKRSGVMIGGAFVKSSDLPDDSQPTTTKP